MLDTAEIVALVAASVLIVGGLTVVVWRDLATNWERIGRARHLVEALIPAAGAALLLGAVWSWAT